LTMVREIELSVEDWVGLEYPDVSVFDR
jgi:hypothetical protein